MRLVTLDEFILTRQKDFPFASGELSGLLQNIALAAKIVNNKINKAGLTNILGTTGDENVQGEIVKKLDIFANEAFINALKISGNCCGIASEENESFVCFEEKRNQRASYVVTFDPLDGSSNIDVNVSIGTIFSIYRRISPLGPCTEEDFLQKGSEQVAAGYIIYGSSTMLVYTTKNGVNGFTLYPSIGEFCLSHPNIKTPVNGLYYSLNQGNMCEYEKGVREFVKYCQDEEQSRKKPYGLRYIGSMVADIHRNLITGGIFMYPAMKSKPNGKLRLVYECNPMSLIVEQAGGLSTTGEQRVLDVEPKELHQRVPIYVGSSQMVYKAQEMLDFFKDELNKPVFKTVGS